MDEHERQALAGFAEEARRPETELRLDRAALLIAAGEYPNLDIDGCLGRLDETAAGAARLAAPGDPPRALAHAVRRRLYDDLGFRGNAADYYDPRNSYLNDVIERRTGIPISLATVFVEVGRRIGLEAAGVGYPRHFLVKYHDDGREWIVDPFGGGDELDGDAFRAEMRRQANAPDSLTDYYLAAVTRRQTLARMLLNLRMIYLQREDYRRALRVQEYTIALTPWSLTDLRDRGVLRARTGDLTGAYADLEAYITHEPDAADTPALRTMMERLRRAPS